jgi:hypothetical protein
MIPLLHADVIKKGGIAAAFFHIRQNISRF